MKKVLLTMVLSAAALYQSQALANQCDETYVVKTFTLPFYQVWSTLGNQQGYGRHINCLYQDNQGHHAGYLATIKGTPDTDHGANWGEDGNTGAWYCQASADRCLFYDDNSQGANTQPSNIATGSKSQPLNDPLNWYSTGLYAPIKVNNTQGSSIIVSVNTDVSCKYATLIHCNGTTSYIQPGQSYTCVTTQSVDWESASTSPGPAIPSIPTFGTYIVTPGNTQ